MSHNLYDYIGIFLSCVQAHEMGSTYNRKTWNKAVIAGKFVFVLFSFGSVVCALSHLFGH